ncbi:MAG TPA: hypothetical protein VM529_08695, partial [Gemmata sp.]|nr:hypothetical protein [Gemmata sp.]
MVVGNKVKTVTVMLPVDVLLDRAEVVADVEFARRLHAAENSRASDARRVAKTFTSNGRRHGKLPGLFFKPRTRLNY